MIMLCNNLNPLWSGKLILKEYPKILPVSDCTILLEFDHRISELVHKKIFSLITHLINNPIEGVINIHPGYTSMLFTLHKMANIYDTIKIIENSLDIEQDGKTPQARLVEIPVPVSYTHLRAHET